MASFFQFVLDNPTKPWDWCGLSSNPNITWQIVKENPTKPWNWWQLSFNPNITWQIVRENLNKDWNWWNLSINTFGWRVENRERIIERNNFIKEELYEVALHPRRIQKWLDNGMQIEDL